MHVTTHNWLHWGLLLRSGSWLLSDVGDSKLIIIRCFREGAVRCLSTVVAVSFGSTGPSWLPRNLSKPWLAHFDTSASSWLQSLIRCLTPHAWAPGWQIADCGAMAEVSAAPALQDPVVRLVFADSDFYSHEWLKSPNGGLAVRLPEK